MQGIDVVGPPVGALGGEGSLRTELLQNGRVGVAVLLKIGLQGDFASVESLQFGQGLELKTQIKVENPI